MAGISIPTTPGAQRPTTFPTLTAGGGGLPGRPTLGGPAPSPNTPTTPPPQFASGPYGTAYQWSGGGIWGGTDVGGEAGGFNVTQPGWYPVQKPRTQQDQINEEMQLAQLRRMNLENDMLVSGGVPRTGTSRATSSAGGGGGEQPERPAPSVSDIKRATTTLQPTLPPAPPMPTAPPQVEAPKPADTSAARALAYGRAKDVIAGETSAALKGLRESSAQRGVSSSKGEREITRASLGQLANVAAQQAGEEVGTTNRFAELGYQGGLTQRGQNLQAILAAAQQALAARGQNISALPNPVSYIGPLTALQQAGGSLY